MDNPQFDKLEEKINTALSVIRNLKTENQELTGELSLQKNRVEELEMKLLEKDDAYNRLQAEFSEKTSNFSEAGERIQSLIAKLEEENLEPAMN